MSDVESIASLSFMFRSIRKCSEQPYQTLVCDATNGRGRTYSGSRWLLRRSSEIHDLWVSTHTYRSLAMGGGLPFGRCSYEGFDVILAARLVGGRVFAETWQDRTVLHDWLKRPTMLGRVVHWDISAYVIGSNDYEGIKR